MFFKNVFLAAAGNTFSFLDIQPFLCLFLGFSSPRGEVGGNAIRQSWVGTCPVRVEWERIPPEAVPLSFLCYLKCRLLENVLLAAAGSMLFSSLFNEIRRNSIDVSMICS